MSTESERVCPTSLVFTEEVQISANQRLIIGIEEWVSKTIPMSKRYVVVRGISVCGADPVMAPVCYPRDSYDSAYAVAKMRFRHACEVAHERGYTTPLDPAGDKIK